MKPKTSLNLVGLWALFTVLALSACKKGVDEPKSIPIEEKKYLNVVLHPYLKPTEIDSAIAKWKVSGAEKSVRLSLRNDSLYADVQSFTRGAGTMTVQLFSNKKLENKSLQFERTVNLDLRHNSDVRINGPESIQDVNWRPRIIFSLLQNNSLIATTIVAVRPGDNYFEFQKIDPAWRHRIIVERVYYKRGSPNHVIADGAWDCTNNCPGGSGDYINTTHFQFLAQQAGNRSWDRAAFLVRLYSAPNNAVESNFDHNF
ncbi:MAG TPA: hypothetical protein VEY10_10645 [Flavisolibacter sp.]|jgi:hypothetical protein|nr:hypothetical protein [Flavisolibacter sp.]